MAARRSPLNVVVVSADDFPGLYPSPGEIDFTLLDAAHDHCFEYFCQWLETHHSTTDERPDVIIVDNTNVRLWHMSQYRAVARRHNCPVYVVDLGAGDGIDPSVALQFWEQFKVLAHRNVHGVGASKIRLMAKEWEEVPHFWGVKQLNPNTDLLTALKEVV